VPDPDENAEVGRPERLDLKAILWHFLHFRLEVVTNRLEHELESLEKRMHVLEGFEKVFDALDEIIKIIRKSDGKADSAAKIMKRFELDAEQTDAILELKLYRLARLEILVIQNELADKRKRARQISGLLKDEEARWKVVREEIEAIQTQYAKTDKRRTIIEAAEEVAFTEDDFIVEEDNVVIVSRDGWLKRQKEVRDLSTTRLRRATRCWRCCRAARARRRCSSPISGPPTRRESSTCPRRPDTASRFRSSSSCATASA
jgi:DNA gyrase subunit A